jgi:hypothetical protein
VEGLHYDTLTFTVTSDDPVFSGSYVSDVPVLIIDNECGPLGYPTSDLNKDCCVNIIDLSLMAKEWLHCTINDSIMIAN